MHPPPPTYRNVACGVLIRSHISFRIDLLSTVCIVCLPRGSFKLPLLTCWGRMIRHASQVCNHSHNLSHGRLNEWFCLVFSCIQVFIDTDVAAHTSRNTDKTNTRPYRFREGSCHQRGYEAGDRGHGVGDAHEGPGQIRGEVLVWAHITAVDGPVASHGHAQHHDGQSLVAFYEAHGDQSQHGAIYSCTRDRGMHRCCCSLIL